ncbi:MAG: hypothetical protein RML72_01620 [Bacteroidia bacterium]|nr:hypothetical protein [Bacteroidia bacterium]MDW8157558.1 hypothetical protein [Bacteroidia bacterium]
MAACNNEEFHYASGGLRAFDLAHIEQYTSDSATRKSTRYSRLLELGVGLSFMQFPDQSIHPSTLSTTQFGAFGEISLIQVFFVRMHIGGMFFTTNAPSFYSSTETSSSSTTMIGVQPGIRAIIPLGKLSYMGLMFSLQNDVYDSPFRSTRKSYPLIGFTFKAAPIAASLTISPIKCFQISLSYVFQLSRKKH